MKHIQGWGSGDDQFQHKLKLQTKRCTIKYLLTPSCSSCCFAAYAAPGHWIQNVSIHFIWFYSCVFGLQCLARVSFQSTLQKVIFVYLRSTCAFVISKHTIIYLPINSISPPLVILPQATYDWTSPAADFYTDLEGLGWSEIVTAEFSSGACTVGGIIKWVAQSQILCVAFLHCRDCIERLEEFFRRLWLLPAKLSGFFIWTLFSSFAKRPVGSQSGSFIPG